MIEKTPHGWAVVDGHIEKTFEFANFVDAIKFINQLVPLAEAMNHHPDVELFAYKMVKIKLITHSQNSLTQKDLTLADKINKLN